VRTYYGQGGRGSSNADVRTFWCKNLGFFEIYGLSAQIREEEVESQWGLFEDKGEGFFRCGRRTFWCKKLRIFEIYGVSARTRQEGLSQGGFFEDKGRGQFFAIL